MKKLYTKSTFLVTLIFGAIAFLVMSHSAGIAGQTGSPSETTCAKAGCHNTFAINSGPGNIAIADNIPGTGYVPGQTYSISVTINQSGISLFGFDFEALKSNNTSAGTLVVTNAETQLMTATNGRQNITHVTNGGATAGSHTFLFDWIAPAAATGTVTFYATGNAANNSNNALNDYIYKTSLSVTENTTATIITGTVNGSPFCAGQTGIAVPYAASGVFGGANIFTAELSDATGSFASPTVLGTLSSTSSGTIITSNPLPAITGNQYRIRVTGSTPSTNGTDNGTNLTIDPLPSTSNAGTDQNICGSTATLAANTPSTGNGNWSVIAGGATITNSSSPNSTVTSLSAGQNIFVWTISNSCGTNPDTVIINSSQTPTAANAGPDQNACTNSVTLNGNIPAIGTGNWSLISGSGTISNPPNPSTTVTGLGAGNNIFTWTISNPPCAASVDTVIINQSGSITVAAAGPDQILCNTTATLAGNTPTAGTGLWTLISGTGTITNASNPSTTVTGLGVGNNFFQWTISNGTCTPTTDDVTITVTAPPTTANAGADQTVCTNFASLNANNPAIGTGVWSQINGTGTIANTNSAATTVTGLSVGINTFVWSISNSPCSSSADTVVITQNGSITIANAGPDTVFCGNAISLSANSPAVGETGSWSIVSGLGIISNSANPTSGVTNLSDTSSNIFVWTISNGVCVPTTDTVVITAVHNPSTANAGADQAICDTAAIFSANTPLYGNGLWTLISGSGTILSPSSPTTNVSALGNGVNKFLWTMSNSPCPSSSDTINITVYYNPTISNAGPNQSVCTTAVTLAANTPVIGTGAWSVVSGTGSFTNVNSPTTTVTGVANGTNVYRWTISNGTCTSSQSDVTIVNCNDITTSTINGSPFCQQTSYSVLVYFTSFGTFSGYYTAELSDSSGSFANPVAIGSGPSSPLSAFIPSSSLPGNKYRIRVVNSNPAIIGTDNGTDLEINTCQPLITGTINGSPFCASTTYNVSVPFTFVGNFTGPFVAQLSDAAGSFNSPVTIGYSNSSPVAAVIPTGTPYGINYRIRISDVTAGVDGQDNGSNLSINTCGAIGIEEKILNELICIAPNPNNGKFDLILPNSVTEIINIVITDNLGGMVYKGETSQNNITEFSLQLPAGFYTLHLFGNGTHCSKKLVIH